MKKITFIINTAKNEKEYIRILMESLLNGIDVNLHDIMIFVDSDCDIQNTTQMLVNLNPLFPNLTIIKNNGDPVGYAGNINYLFSKAKTEWAVYLQSDMVVPLNFDTKLLSHIANNRVICCVRCEPPLHAQYDNSVTFVRNFGLTPDEFRYEDFLKFAEANKNETKLTNYYFAPFMCQPALWNKLGGHDTTFKKSREDSDIALRLALNNCELKQTWDAIVYHFTCTSSRQWALPENRNKNINADNDKIELDRFIKKWGFFAHPSSPQDVAHLITSNPEVLKKIVVKNPPIDESKLTIL